MRISIDIEMGGARALDARDALNATLGAYLNALEDRGVIWGWAYSRETLDEIISGGRIVSIDTARRERIEKLGVTITNLHRRNPEEPIAHRHGESVHTHGGHRGFTIGGQTIEDSYADTDRHAHGALSADGFSNVGPQSEPMGEQ